MNTPFSLQSAADRLIASVGQVIKGKDDVIRKTAVCLFCGGHILLEDVPGTGKTTHEQCGNVILIVLVEVIVKVYKPLKVFPCFYFFDFNS